MGMQFDGSLKGPFQGQGFSLFFSVIIMCLLFFFVGREGPGKPGEAKRRPGEAKEGQERPRSKSQKEGQEGP